MLKMLLCGAAVAALAVGTAKAEVADGAVKIGILTDMGATYSDLSGQGSVIAAEMAIEDFGDTAAGAPIELISADHQNKPDIAAATANEWIDQQGVDMIADLVTSSVALAVQGIGTEKNTITMTSGAATSRLTGSDCGPYGFHWAYNTRALANGTGKAVVENGGDTWYFLTADYAFGHSLAGDVGAVVEAGGGQVLGESRHPFPSTDFSSFLLQAQGSGAKVIGLANAGADTTNSIRQANEFGITQAGQQLAGLLMFITDVHSLGLETAEGLYLTTGFYWDRDDATRAFAERFMERHGTMPTMVHAGVYSSVLHYLRAVEAAGTDDPDAVAAAMRELPIDDFFAANASIQPNGRMVHDMYLAQVKAPGDSSGEWDLYNIVSVIPGIDAYGAAEDSGCALVN